MTHHVKIHSWVNGVLKTISRACESFEEAVEFIKKSDAHAVKIYDDRGQLVHSAQTVNPEPYVNNTYA